MKIVNKRKTGVNIMLMLEGQGMTRSELADRLEVAYVTVNSWINGRRAPRICYVTEMCTIFGCDFKDIVVLESTEK